LLTAHRLARKVGLAEGLFFDSYFDQEDSPHAFRLLSYTEPIDAWYFTREGLRTIEAPKPSQDIPKNLDLLIKRLERERPRHWVLAAVALLDGDQESRDLWDEAVAHARERVTQVGWSNASQVFSGRLGVTLYVDLRTEWPEIRARVAAYCRAKAKALDQPNWVAVGEGASGGLFIVRIERRPELPLASVFLQPPAVRPDALLTATDGDSDEPDAEQVPR